MDSIDGGLEEAADMNQDDAERGQAVAEAMVQS